MKKFFFTLLIVCLSALIAISQENTFAIRLKKFNVEKKIGIQGYDPVAYFTQNVAVKGKADFSFEFSGIKYLFSSKQNLDLFKSIPEKYEPQYGGWCAYAMGNDGSKVEVDPETFKILDGKLYLFYNFYFNNTLKKWNADENVLKKNADNNWQLILSK